MKFVAVLCALCALGVAGCGDETDDGGLGLSKRQVGQAPPEVPFEGEETTGTLTADVQLPADFAGEVMQVSVVLYNAPVDAANIQTTFPAVTFPPVTDVDGPLNIEIDLTSASTGVAEGELYVSVYVYTQLDSPFIPDPAQDYWFQEATPRTFDGTSSHDLGTVTVAAITP